MGHEIKDATGAAYGAKVSKNNRFYTNALTATEGEHATEDGRSYNLNTGPIILTDDVETPVMYVKNNETERIHISAIAIGLNTALAADADDIVKIRITKNPTGGTIFSEEVDIDINSNRDFDSSNDLSVNAYKGSTGKTMTGDANHILIFSPDFNRIFAPIDESLPKGSSIGITIEPPANNTGLEVYSALICHLGNPDD